MQDGQVEAGCPGTVFLVEQSEAALPARQRRSPDASAPSELDRSVSQTLSRGIQVLEVLAAEGRPLTAQQIATALGLSRPVVYRLLRTLAQHQ